MFVVSCVCVCVRMFLCVGGGGILVQESRKKLLVRICMQ